MKPTNGEHDVYQIVTDRIIGLLEQGTVPWRRRWSDALGPRNATTNRPYRGINLLILGCQAYDSAYWLTYREAEKLGGHVKRGEKGTMVVYWNWHDVKREDPDSGETTVKSVPFLRYYVVFSVLQTEGCKLPAHCSQLIPSRDGYEVAQQIVDGMPDPPRIVHYITDCPSYSPRIDTVHVPSPASYETVDAYYSTLFHELTHSTGTSSRCNRGIERNDGFGSETYSKEELVAAMGAAFLCNRSGIEQDTIGSNAAYIAGWLKQLRSDRRLVVQAAAAAQKASDWILDRGREQSELETAELVAA